MSKHLRFNSIRHNMSKLVRNETLDGEDYIVVPTIAITEGVWNGVLYTNEELSKFPDAWNGVPVTNAHPQENGQPQQASTQSMIETFKVGLVLNTRFETGKLKCEIWLNKKLCEEKAPEILQNIQDEIDTDVSTGLYTDDIVGDGDFNGIKYNTQAINYRPDHLAILLHEDGACSWADGAGMVRNKKDEEGTFKTLFKKFGKKFGFKQNEISHSDIRYRIGQLVYPKYDDYDNGVYAYIRDVFDDYFVFELETKESVSFNKQAYQVDAQDTLTLVGEPIEVIIKTDYITKTNKQNKQNGGTAMNKAELVTALIVNKANQWAEGDREVLMGMDDAVLAKINAKVEVEKPVEKVAEVKPVEKPVENKKELSMDEYLKDAPEAVKSIVVNALKEKEDAKKASVASLVANKKCGYTEAQLLEKDNSELEIITNMLKTDEVDNSTNNFAGNAPAPKANAEMDFTPEVTL